MESKRTFKQPKVLLCGVCDELSHQRNEILPQHTLIKKVHAPRTSKLGSIPPHSPSHFSTLTNDILRCSYVVAWRVHGCMCYIHVEYPRTYTEV